jgi:enoyl-CoA hydratase
MACTLRLAADNAKFGQPEVKLGLIPGLGGTQRLARLIGRGRALQLILSGAMIGAQEAWRMGLVNEIVPHGELIARAETILRQCAARDQIRHPENKGVETSLPEGLALEELALRHLRRNQRQG